ncbi:MAG TPA: DUF1015 family protein [Chitinophagales bacterium]|nr:MAG: hypothetical protein BGO32_05435 [Bacteroidetes bacterium 37-13]HRN94834.1 DUF1015 family protein [Chitinophagales bacterium]HRP38739.1 DUF1015 family protein [Chitinophagales bacterium]
MATVRPFKSLSPKAALASQVASLPYDVMNSEEAKEMAAGNPFSFLHVSKAEIDLPQNTSQYSESVYEKATANFKKLIADGVLVKDENASFYIYSLTMNGRTQTGLVACCSIEEYENNIIKKHEFTRPEKEEDRIKHIATLEAQTGPIFLTYRDNDAIDKIVENYVSQPPLYSFVANDGVKHEVWRVGDVPAVRTLVQLFAQNVRFLYIADGHHRAASAVKIGQKIRSESSIHTGQEEYNFFLSVLFPASQLAIMDYNRVVKDLNGNSPEQFLNKVKENFEVTEVSSTYSPKGLHDFGMFLNGKWYQLTAKSTTVKEDAIGVLDVTILQNFLLQPILGIEDPRTDKRIDFVGGIRGLKELEKRVNSGEMAVAFALFPVSLEQLMAIADTNNVMPPKSTWFEPKLRDGLFIHQI